LNISLPNSPRDLEARAENLVARGRLMEAREVLIRLCQEQDDNADAWLFLAAIDEQAGLYLDAERYALRALTLDPGEAEIHFLISRVRWARGVVKEALLAVETATGLDPSSHGAWLHLGNIKRGIGETHEAESALRRALDLEPGDGATRVLLARVLLRAGKMDDAAVLCASVKDGDAARSPAQVVRGRVLYAQGKPVEGRECWRRIASGEPGYDEAQFLLGAHGKAAIDALQRRRWFYDSCAHAYNYLTTEIAQYRLPARLKREMRRILPDQDRSLTVLDAGCGVGACGHVFRPLAFTLTGVDISGRILDHAGPRGVYDTLIRQDAISFMHEFPSTFDVIVATDVFESYEEITQALKAARQALRPGGMLILSPSAPRVTPDGFDPDVRCASLARLHALVDEKVWRTEGRGYALAYRFGDRSIRAPLFILRTRGDRKVARVIDGQSREPPRKSGADKILAAQMQQGSNDLNAAYRLFRQALRINPESADASFGLGFVRQSRGQFKAARRYYRLATELDTTHFGAWFQLGTIAQHLGQMKRAAACYEKAIMFEPKLAMAYHNLSILRYEEGNLTEAARLRSRAAMEDPVLASLYQQAPQPSSPFAEAETTEVSGLTRTMISAGTEPEAGAIVERATLLLTRGIKLREQHRCLQAIPLLKEVAELLPNEVVSHVQLALALQDAGRIDEALASLDHAAALSQTPWEVWQSIAGVHAAVANMEEAYRWYQRVSDEAPPESNVHGSDLFMMNYHYVPAEQVAEKHLAWGRRFEQAITPISEDFTNSPMTGRRLRIGYLSADFFGHSVAWFLEPLLAWHSHDEVEVYCYANVESYDVVTMRMRYYADRWLRIRHLDDTQVAQQIRADRIDILVDLSGHTGGCRPGVLALRAAPVQVTYLGYANTTGLSRVDYRVTDANADPEGMTDIYYSERLFRLPRCFLCYKPFDMGPPVRWSAAGATHTATFACFNNLYKVNDHVIAVWSRILRELPDSVLVIKSQSFRIQTARENILSKFAVHGIDPSQLRLPDKLTYNEHLDLYANMDVLLDPFPYNGTTTTCETLWMGSPVVTLAGDRHSGRVGVSILKAVGLEELIADDDDDYVRKAVELASDRQRLGEYRKTMRDRLCASSLLDGKDLARSMESTYRIMWVDWCSRQHD
jgi:predicted O-linked N-acetylglucosamine transferase (SPINDLY family)/predicted TPR repeat methyltransferase